MKKAILVINTGSSSIRFSCYTLEDLTKVLSSGHFQSLNGQGTVCITNAEETIEGESPNHSSNHEEDIQWAFDILKQVVIYQIQREMASLMGALEGIDGIVFSAGIGEHSKKIRRRVCEGLSWTGALLDKNANDTNQLSISHPKSKIEILVIPTNEEIIIGKHCKRLITYYA